MQHTPGPWRICPAVQTDRGTVFGINAHEDQSGIAGDTRLAEVFAIEANARLTAAAPDLLEALRASLPYMIRLGDFIGNGEGPTGMDRCDHIGKILSAIDKAAKEAPDA